MNVEIGTEAAQFLFWEYINGIFVAVRQTAPAGATHSCFPFQSSNDDIILCYGSGSGFRCLFDPWIRDG